MRLFLDTNIFPEFINRREQYESVCQLVELSHVTASQAIDDESFTDIEDSFQYHCALENYCNVLVTINVDDFKKADHSQIES